MSQFDHSLHAIVMLIGLGIMKIIVVLMPITCFMKKKPHLMELQVVLNSWSKKYKIRIQVIIQQRSIKSMASVITIHSLFSIA